MPPIKRTRDRIRSFADLPQGWNFGDGYPATNDAIRVALEVVDLIEMLGKFSAVQAFPEVSGGVLVSSRYGETSLKVLCGPRSQIEAWEETEDDILDNEDGMVSIKEVEDRLRRLATWRKQNSSGFSLYSISIATKDVLQVQLFETPPTDPVYRSSESIVRREQVEKSALILQNTIVNSPQTLWYSGGYEEPIFLMQSWSGKNHPLEIPATSISREYKIEERDASSRKFQSNNLKYVEMRNVVQ